MGASGAQWKLQKEEQQYMDKWIVAWTEGAFENATLSVWT